MNRSVMNKSVINRFSAIVVLICLSGLSTHSNAAEKLLLTGVETTSDSSRYFYLGALIPLDKTLSRGFALHLWTDFQEYFYDAGAAEIDVNANSVSAAIAYHDSGSNYWWNTKVGIIRSDTRLTPVDPGNPSIGKLTDLQLQFGGERHLSSTVKINGIVDYITDRDAYWSRLRLLWQISEQRYHGPEIIIQGDPNYDVQQIGWVITGIKIQGHSTLSAKLGFRKSDGTTSGYVGVELVVPY
jgi:hypothetical protein